MGMAIGINRKVNGSGIKLHLAGHNRQCIIGRLVVTGITNGKVLMMGGKDLSCADLSFIKIFKEPFKCRYHPFSGLVRNGALFRGFTE